MKTLFLPLAISMLTACSHTAHVRLTLGPPKKEKGSEVIEFRAQIENHSEQPVWFYANIMPTNPYYRAFTRRSALARWDELPYGQCGVGATAYEVPPSAAKSFQTIAPAEDCGQQYRIALDIFSSDRKKSRLVTSKAVVLP